MLYNVSKSEILDVVKKNVYKKSCNGNVYKINETLYKKNVANYEIKLMLIIINFNFIK